jgi:hypothetical protein
MYDFEYNKPPSADYRAHCVTVMAKRAVAAAQHSAGTRI